MKCHIAISNPHNSCFYYLAFYIEHKYFFISSVRPQTIQACAWMLVQFIVLWTINNLLNLQLNFG